MGIIIRYLLFISVMTLLSCNEASVQASQGTDCNACLRMKGALLSTQFRSLGELKSSIEVEHFRTAPNPNFAIHGEQFIRLTYAANGQKTESILHSGLSEKEINQAKDGGFWDKVWLALNAPFILQNKDDLQRVLLLSRRRPRVFGEGAVAFYDLSLAMVNNISDEDMAVIKSEDLSEKGYLNTFNHITGQVFMTALFSEKLADFIADTHERTNLTKIATGDLSEAQLNDLENGPVDNYVDIINNEWGQELGKCLAKKFGVTRKTYWTPNLLADFLNEVQAYYSRSFHIAFRPFWPTDELVVKFTEKINKVKNDDMGPEF